MKNMRILPIALMAVLGVFVLVAIASSYDKSPNKEEGKSEHRDAVVDNKFETSKVEDSDAQQYTPPVIPSFVEKLLERAEWWADTICVANGKTYYIANEDYSRTLLIYDDRHILLDDPLLRLHPCDPEGGTKFYVSVVDQGVLTDFSDAQSLKGLSSLSRTLPSFTRYKKDFFADFGNIILYSFSADFPKKSVSHADDIRKWLVKRMIDTQPMNEEIPSANASLFIRYNERPKSGLKYRGDLYDPSQIAEFVSKFYFALKKGEYGPDNEYYPNCLFSNLSLTARVMNDRFVTYQQHTHEFNAGTHGYYTEKLLSYDHVHQQEIDFNYLFSPLFKQQILNLLLEASRNHPWYEEREEQIQEFVCPTDEDENPTGEFKFPSLGLTEEGVVFSFQPYAIDCFAAGAFHYVVPYKKLRPYMTEQGKWCVGI